MNNISNYEHFSEDELNELLTSIVINTNVPVGLGKTNKTKSIYFAAPWFDNKSKMMYNAVKKIYNLCKSYSDFNMFFPKDNGKSNPKETFDTNLQMIDECTDVIAMIDRKDCGTSFEIGYALSKNKNIWILVLDNTSMTSKTNIMLAYSGKVINMYQLNDFFTRRFDVDDAVTYDDDWEGKE